MQWNDKVFGVKEGGFEALALEIFRFQSTNNPIYKAYLEALNVNPRSVSSIIQIPFLPIRFFKSHAVQSTLFEPAAIFESSGTTGTINSRHLIKDLSLYEESFIRGFELFYGPVKEYCILGLLPSYLERNNSSLVYMVDKLIQLSKHPQSGFYLDEYEKLFIILSELEKRKQKIILIGVTFALLDFAEKFSLPLHHTIVMETGGMKGRREEMIRLQVHDSLKKSLDVSVIHSEYGMTELLSQAYSKGEGIFNCPPWMKVMVRDEEDPLLVKENGSGIINIIDLANIYSSSFIATDDAGKINADGSFEVLGRMDGSDLRGCSLMVI
jgi:hypothetical protein